ncbi:MAG: SOS response-associated peptidase family protein, partial [Xanthobacteraceae bacterium]
MSLLREWQDTLGGKRPWYFTARDGSPALTIAGLSDEWRDKTTSETLKSCTMIITEPNKFVPDIHDRMPVLPREPGFDPWLMARPDWNAQASDHMAGISGCLRLGGGADFHARYLLTDRGGLRIDAGFSTDAAGQKT